MEISVNFEQRRYRKLLKQDQITLTVGELKQYLLNQFYDHEVDSNEYLIGVDDDFLLLENQLVNDEIRDGDHLYLKNKKEYSMLPVQKNIQKSQENSKPEISLSTLIIQFKPKTLTIARQKIAIQYKDDQISSIGWYILRAFINLVALSEKILLELIFLDFAIQIYYYLRYYITGQILFRRLGERLISNIITYILVTAAVQSAQNIIAKQKFKPQNKVAYIDTIEILILVINIFIQKRIDRYFNQSFVEYINSQPLDKLPTNKLLYHKCLGLIGLTDGEYHKLTHQMEIHVNFLYMKLITTDSDSLREQTKKELIDILVAYEIVQSYKRRT